MTGGAGSVLFCGAWDDGPGYPRTQGLRQGIERLGVSVRECRVNALGAQKRELLSRPWRWPLVWWRTRRDRRRLLRQLRQLCAADAPRCVIVPYPGHHLVAPIKRSSPVPVVLDLFLSAYDTVVEDRGLCRPGSLGAAAMQQLDTRACAAADLVLLDTPENAAYTATLTGLPPERFAWLPLTDPDAQGCIPFPVAKAPLRILFFGTGVPLHGLDVLIDAVTRVEAVELVLVGGTWADRATAQQRLGPRLRLEPEFVDRARLRELMRDCHLVAGVFGPSGKAQRVVPWKVVIALAAGRAVVTAETPAICGWLDGSGAVFLTPAGDAAALAATLTELAADPLRVERAAAAACMAYDRHFASDRAAERWHHLLERVETETREATP
ncbi:MAG: glycosyltransferase [Planctomycetes bacterium]|nr:glycosyltransferase [Planctomycetota bacterium]